MDVLSTWSPAKGLPVPSATILKGLARHIHEKHTMLADVEEDQEQDIICFNDITGKELPWRAVRKARELGLKYLRDLEVFEKVDEKEAVEKYGDGLTQTKPSKGEPMQIRSRICVREFKSDDRPDLDHYIDCSEPQGNFLNHAHRCFTCIFSCEGSETSADTTPSRGPNWHRCRKGWIDEEEHVTRDAASNWERDWQENVKKWGFQLGFSSKNLFHQNMMRVSKPQISWMWKKETCVSHSSTDSETISLDAGLHMDANPALDLRDLVVDVMHSNSDQK